MWALAVKRKLGDTYHLSVGRGLGYLVARCDKRIRLEADGKTEKPLDAHVCARCQNIEWQQNRNMPSRAVAQS